MKIAIPVENGRLHGHFGGCRQFALVQVDPEKKLTLGTEVVAAPEHQPGLFPRWLSDQGVQVVIAGGIGHRALALFAQQGINVVAGPPGETVEAVVEAYLTGRLTARPAGCEHPGQRDEHA